MNIQQFEEAVREVIKELPAEILKRIDNLQIFVKDHPEKESELLGLYHGVPLLQRDTHYGGSLPDTITIYKKSHEKFFKDKSELKNQIRLTVLHEIAHYLGFSEEELEEWEDGI